MSDKMREALAGLLRPYVNALKAGRDRIIPRGGQCNSVDEMERAALAEQPAQGEAVGKAKLWDTLNAALMSRSGITLDNERDCYEAARQWAEAHDDASSYKAAAQKLREERDTIAALKVEAVTLTAPPAPAVPDGWKLVPVEPTAQMIQAAKIGDPLACDVVDDEGVYLPIYAAMLAAAPEVKP